MEERNENVHISEDNLKEFEDVPESVGTPTKILPTSEKNKRNTEEGENKCNEGKRKRGRPSEKDKECLPESKKGRKTSPIKRKALKTMVTKDKMIYNKKAKGYNGIFKKAVNMEKCIFCDKEYLDETIWEEVGHEKSELIRIPLCKGCHACLKDATVMQEMRLAIERSRFKMNGEAEKVE